MSDVTGCIVIPGPKGATGAAGAAGTNGIDCITETTAQFVMPDGTGVNNTVDVEVVDSRFMIPRQGTVNGLIVYVEFAGYMEVYSVTDDTHVTLLNPDDGTAYGSNAAIGTVIPVGARIVSAGPQGP